MTKRLKIILITVVAISCNFNFIKTEMKKYKTSQFQEIDGTMLVPDYIGTSINCINIASQVNWNERNPKVVINYFSDYSSVNFFITITDRQIYFETYSKSGTPKPKLIFYVQSIPSNVCGHLFKSFSGNPEQNNRIKNSSSDNKTLSINDNEKEDFEIPFGGDKFPLTKMEAVWLIKRNLKFIKETTGIAIEFDDKLIAPVFYNMCNYEKEFSKWKNDFPEINEHKLIY